ncbi:hypothetical protein TIFTF001_000901 [Ficus carica]|uniref:Glabrous enhancer-binding protein-like DBD domain-containing protein n=1 Tax=Ficus carica TaxID=3494 RepID=A0AA88CKX9_FICCA|nr:hypothetical protein TIFTF001_000901 [Ficus carica]
MPSSSSSSSSSEYDNDDDSNNNSDYDEAESPNDDVSCDDAVDSVSPSTQSPCQPLSASAAAAAVDDPNPSSSTSKRRRSDSNEVVKIRTLSKRVWTKEDELELLHGFLEHTKGQRKISKNGRRKKENYVSSFYNEVKPELQQRFNKSQIVEKLRRLRRKYNQNVANYKKINLSLDNLDQFCFKSSHDKATFEISHEIWNSDQTIVDDNVVTTRTRSQTRSEWLRNTKRVLEISDEGSDTTALIMGLALNCPFGLMKFGDGDRHDQVVIKNDVKDDEKWREQQIMELEVYLRRLELVQAQVKAALDKLRSSGG